MSVGIARGMSAGAGTYGLVRSPAVLCWGGVSRDFPADECGRGGPTDWNHRGCGRRCVEVMSVAIIRGMITGVVDLRTGGDARIFLL